MSPGYVAARCSFMCPDNCDVLQHKFFAILSLRHAQRVQIEELGGKLCYTVFGWIFFFPPKCLNFSIWPSLNKETLLGYLLGDDHCLSKKREEEKILYILS